MPSISGPQCCPDGIKGYGNPDYGVMIVGQNPSIIELTKTRIPFSGSDGELLNSTLSSVGWNRTNVYCTNSVCTNDLSRIDVCYNRLIHEIELFKPRLIVTLGATACENLWHMKISKCRGFLTYQTINGHEFRGLATWLPSAILQAETAEKQNDYAAELVRDLKKIYRYFRPGAVVPQRVLRSPDVIRTVQEAQAILDSLPRNELVTLDIETPTFDKEAKEADPYHQILCVGVGLEGDVQYIFPEDIIGELTWPRDVQWGGWNLYGFDMVALRDRYGIDIPTVHDGMLTSYVRDERTKAGTHKLKHNAREDAGADFYEEEPIRDDLESLYKYNGLDIAYNHRVLKYHLSAFDEDDAKLYYDLLIPAANMYTEAQLGGCRIDLFKWFELSTNFMCESDRILHELSEEASNFGYPGVINPNSDQQVGRFFFEILGISTSLSHPTKGGKWSVDKNVLDLINHPWAAKLRLHRQVTDTKTRYLDKTKAQIKHDLKVHPKVWIPGTTTGRPSYSDPPVQQLPHFRTIGEFARVREIFCADDDDHVLMAADYSQIELWIMYAFSGDKNLYADLTEPWYVTGKADYHSRTCVHVSACEIHMFTCDECYLTRDMCTCLRGFKPHQVTGCPTCNAWDSGRDNQKHVNFGIPYGETAYGLMRPPPIGTGLPFEDCQKLVTTWYKRNSDVFDWQRSIEYILRTTGFIKTPFGRKRRFPIVVNPKQIRQAVNAPIQGTASDYTLSSAIELMPLVKPLGVRLLWTTHDEILLHVPVKNLEKVKSITREIMEKPRVPGFPSVKTEIKVGQNLYQVSP